MKGFPYREIKLHFTKHVKQHESASLGGVEL